MRVTSFLAMSLFLAASGVAAVSPTNAADSSRVLAPRAGETPRDELTTTSVPGIAAARASSFASLAGVVVWNRNTEARETIRLYKDDGTLDASATHTFMRVAGSKQDAVAGTLSMRLVRLVFRASYHFHGATVAIVSGTRRGANGRHGTGEAMDFALEGVSASALASYLRGTPRAGVGIYVHPKTQYVHLDVRDHSYHWVDASPPGVTWRERLLPDPTQAERDASYDPSLDLPETN
jgi:uncharacterized protein YcbK (DUF882 family)